MPNSLDPNVHYVKFRRGSVSIWNSLLANPSQIDDDTLYFIYDTTQPNPLEGKLYLGQKLISGAGGSSSGIINLGDISNVSIDGVSLADKQILVYNETTEHWENTSLSTIINTAVGEMQGATTLYPGTKGLVPAPAAGDQNKFLRGDATWTDIVIPTFNSDIFVLNNQEVSLQGYSFAPVGAVPLKTASGIQWSTIQTGKLNKMITTLEKLQAQLDGTDLDPLDPDMIYLIDNGTDGSSGSKYDEYIIVNGALEKMGAFGSVDLTNYVQIPAFNTEVTRLNNLLYDTINPDNGTTIPGLLSRVSTIEANYITKAEIGDLNALILTGNHTNLVQEMNSINLSVTDVQERLKWKDLLDN